jgi:hypothetical protein
MPPRSPSLAPSALIGACLDLEESGELQVVCPTSTLARAADAAWSEATRSRLVDWSWLRLVNDYPEALCLVDASGAPRALFCSRRRRPLKLPGGTRYELGYIEIHPDDRGGALGYYALATAAVRAREVGATGLVLGAIPEPGLVRFYSALGAKQGNVKGWVHPRGLLPFFFSEAVLIELEQDFDAARKAKA